jgi:hypothetical protein
MKSAPLGESSDETGLARSANEKVTAISHLAKLVDAATALVLATAALYFWGFVYYSQFCERLGVSFQGITLPLEDYLIVSWMTVTLLILLVGVALALIYLARDIADLLADLLRKLGFKKTVKQKPEPHLHFLTAGLFFICLSGILVLGGKFMLIQANEAADHALARRTRVVIRDAEGKVIDGQFIYLRDFGSALLVGELAGDGKEVGARRILKSSSYSGYSLFAPPTAPEARKQ